MNLISVDYNNMFPNGNLRERRLIINDPYENKDYLGGIPLYIDGEVSLKFSSQFSSIYESEPSTFLTMLSSATNKPLSGQFAIQGAQIWKSTDPLEISVDAKLNMKNSGKKDVVEPALKLAQLCLPSIGGFGKFEEVTDLKLKCLIPPGPNIQSILQDVKSKGYIKGSRGTYDVQIGWLKLTNCIIKEASPSFSKTVDEDGFPVSATISLSIMTQCIPTKDSVQEMLNVMKSESINNSVINKISKIGDEISDKMKNKISFLNI